MKEFMFLKTFGSTHLLFTSLAFVFVSYLFDYIDAYSYHTDFRVILAALFLGVSVIVQLIALLTTFLATWLTSKWVSKVINFSTFFSLVLTISGAVALVSYVISKLGTSIY